MFVNATPSAAARPPLTLPAPSGSARTVAAPTSPKPATSDVFDSPKAGFPTLPLTGTPHPSTQGSPTAALVFRALKDKGSFTSWFKDGASVVTAVHEGLHAILEEHPNASGRLGFYQPYAGGRFVGHLETDPRTLPRPSTLLSDSLYAANKKQGWVDLYLVPGEEKASSHESFEFLLNELNSYVCDLHVYRELRAAGKTPGDIVPECAGAATLTAATVDFLRRLKASAPAQFRALTRDTVVVETLRAAVHGLQTIAPTLSDYREKDVKPFVDRVFRADNQAVLRELGVKLG